MKEVVTLGEAEVRTVEVVQMIKVVFPRGAGVPNDPVREVVQYWTMDGKRMLEVDSHIKYLEPEFHSESAE